MHVFHTAVVLLRNLLGIPISMEPLLGWHNIDARAGREPGKGPRAGKSRIPEGQGSLAPLRPVTTMDIPSRYLPCPALTPCSRASCSLGILQP